jgi:phytoene/squalene synthetase
MDFTQNSIDKIVNQCIRADLLNLYALDKKVDEVKDDCKRAVKNIQEWLAIVLKELLMALLRLSTEFKTTLPLWRSRPANIN